MVISFEDSKETKKVTGVFLMSLVEEGEKRESWKREEIDKIISQIARKFKSVGFVKITGKVSGYANVKDAKVFMVKHNKLKVAIAPLKISRGLYQLGFSSDFIQSRIPYDACFSKKQGKKRINKVVKEYCKLAKSSKKELEMAERTWNY